MAIKAGGEGSGVFTSPGLKVRLFSTWFLSVRFQGCISRPGFVNTVDFTALGLEDACVQLY